jgi:hypothetical protein
MANPLDIVKTALKAYVSKDRAAIEAVIADEYRFSSPIDNALDREAYFAICWPNSKNMGAMEIIHGAENGEHAWIVYEAEAGEKRLRNAELHRVRGGRIIETEVYFGWNIPHPVKVGTHQENDGAGQG